MNDRSHGTAPIFSRALFVTRHMPVPAIEGALQYSLHLLRLVAEMSTRVDLLCCRNEMESKLAAPTLSLPENVRPHFGVERKPTITDKLFTRLPHSALAFATAQNRALLRQLLTEPVDIVVLDHIGSSWALSQVERWLSRDSPGVLWYATHNAERSTRLSLLAMDDGPWSRPARTAAILLDAWRIERNERRLTRVADVTSAIVEADSESYQQDYQPRSVVTVPPAYFGGQLAETRITEARPYRICLLGTFIWSLKKANLRAFLRAGHETFTRRGIELVVIGWIDPRFRSELESKWPGVRFTGAVDTVQDHLRNCRIGVVAEQAGGGFKIKILDYVFAGLPVFALRHVVAGTPLQQGDAAALFDDMSALCAGIAAHIDDIDYLDQLQRAARQACRCYLPELYDVVPLQTALRDARQQKAGAQRVGS